MLDMRDIAGKGDALGDFQCTRQTFCRVPVRAVADKDQACRQRALNERKGMHDIFDSLDRTHIGDMHQQQLVRPRKLFTEAAGERLPSKTHGIDKVMDHRDRLS